MKKISDLNLGFSDAENYKRRENKEFLNRVFIRNEYLNKLCSSSISFLIGEKGTGKTAYSVYLSNNNYKENLASLRYIRETDYQKFVALKKEKQLQLSDYSSIWKVIIYLLLSQHIIDKEEKTFLSRFSKIRYLKEAIDEYYHKAFSPEISVALQFLQESAISASLISKHAADAGEEKNQQIFSEQRFQTNLLYIQKKFEEALSQIKLTSNHIVFIDGIDIRPSSMDYIDYLECVKGLANATWEINNDFFPSIRDNKSRMRCVLLIRPDIFASIGLQNQNTKIRDNSVFLDWRTEYVNYRASDIFRVIDRLLSIEQTETSTPGKTWDHYFPWDAPNIYDFDKYKENTAFLSFLRWSYYRPRDIITMLTILQEIHKADAEKKAFSYEDFDSPNFKRLYSDYLLGEIKDHLTFYYSDADYEKFLKFFEFLKGKNKFTYSEYLDAFKDFTETVGLNDESSRPNFMSTPSTFLQFLYDLNIICYIEKPANDDKPYVRWCFRERSYANISPAVKENATYQIFYGLGKALNVGQHLS